MDGLNLKMLLLNKIFSLCVYDAEVSLASVILKITEGKDKSDFELDKLLDKTFVAIYSNGQTLTIEDIWKFFGPEGVLVLTSLGITEVQDNDTKIEITDVLNKYLNTKLYDVTPENNDGHDTTD